MSFEELSIVPLLTDIKAAVIDTCVAAKLKVTSWIFGDPSERWIEVVSRVIGDFTSIVQVQYVRAWFLDTATDPGDPGDISADQTPRPGWLSALGVSWYGTTRRGQTEATGFLSLTNANAHSITFYPLDFTFQSSIVQADGGFPTYKNSADPSVYVNLGGSKNLAAGATVILPIVADQIGSYANAQPGDVSIVVTGTFGTLTCSNASPVLGTEREPADSYRDRCRTAADQQSPGGPGNAYRRAATTAIGGSPLQRHDGSGTVGITRTFVSADSSLGTVACYFADDDGPADATDVQSANANIEGVGLGVITDPIGIVPDCVTYTGATSTATSIVVSGSFKFKTRPGVTAAILRSAIVAALVDAFAHFEIGGVDQVAGAGVIYTIDLEGIARSAYAGIYDLTTSKPSAASVAIALGHVATLITYAALVITGAASAAGVIKITTGVHGLITGATVAIFGVVGTTEANGDWTITVVDATRFTLNGSTFTHVYVSGGALSTWQAVFT